MMLHGTRFISVVGGVLISAVALAQATPPAGAPAGATGLCKDGTYWTGATKRGACHGHKGVQDWYAATDSATSAPGAAPVAAPAPTAAAPAATAAPASAAKSGGGPAPSVAQAAGGGPGLVWVNTKTNVYHCSTDKWYGKTKSGEYMSEADAIAKGDHADHGKACSK